MNKFIPDIKDQLVEAWAKGWAIARGVALPVRDHEGFRIDPGWPDQLSRYVFTEINEGFKSLTREIQAPWIFLKVCAEPERVKEYLPAPWVIQEPRFMMTCFKPMQQWKVSLPEGYRLSIEKSQAVSTVRIMQKEETVAIGRLVVVDEYAIYDRIETLAEHRRLGLASLVMLELEKLAVVQRGVKGVLVATMEGQRLYKTLGWEMYSAYTTAVIPGSEK